VTLYDGLKPETVNALDQILDIENLPMQTEGGEAIPELPSMEEIDAEEDSQEMATAGAAAIPPPSAPRDCAGPRSLECFNA
jgi:hypothetical protein